MVYISKNQIRNQRWNSYIEQAQNGNLNAFELFIEELRPCLTAYYKKHIRIPQDTEDLVEETILILFKKLSEICSINISGYAYTIAKNKIIDQKRKPPIENCVEFRFDDVPDPFSLEDRILNIEEAKFLLGIGFPQLLPTQKKVLILNSGGMKCKEIAEILDIPVDTVKTRILRGRRKLKQVLSTYQQV